MLSLGYKTLCIVITSVSWNIYTGAAARLTAKSKGPNNLWFTLAQDLQVTDTKLTKKYREF